MKSIETQKALIGTLIIRPELFLDVSDIVQPVMFAGPLKSIAEAIWQQSDQGKGWDASIIHAMTGEKLVWSLPDLAAPMVLIEQAQVVADEYYGIQFLDITQKAGARIRGGEEAKQVAGETIHQIEMLNDFATIDLDNRTADVNATRDLIYRAQNNRGECLGLPTGFSDLDEMIGGWNPGDFVIIAARPFMGKTTVALSYILHSARIGKPTAFFSLEMQTPMINIKLISMMSGVSVKRIMKGKLSADDQRKVNEATEELHDLPLFVMDSTRVKSRLSSIRDKMRIMTDRMGVELFGLDYIQLVSGDGNYRGNKHQEITDVAQTLQNTAKQLQAPIITLSQLNRGVEARGGSKRPGMSDMRESGSLEEVGDQIHLLYRPEYYQIFDDEEGNSLVGVLEYIVAKNKMFGDTGTLLRKWDGENYRQYSHYDPAPAEVPASNQIPASARPGMDEDLPF